MSAVHERGRASRAAIVRNGVASRDVPGVFVAEDHSLEQTFARLAPEIKDSYARDELFGQFCQTAAHVGCPVEMAFEYASNVFSLEEWTVSLRDFSYVGGGLYRARDLLAHDTSVFVRVDAHPASGVIDYACAWDQADELWLRLMFRFVDAEPLLKQPGTVVTWTNCKHAYFDRDTPNVPAYISQPRARTDRAWVGDGWPVLYASDRLELGNLKRILEARYATR